MAELILTKDLIKAAVPDISQTSLDKYSAALISVMSHFGINTRRRAAAFLAQISHESQSFSKMVENMNYSASRLREVFGKYFTKSQADLYANQPEKIANRVYANRMGNGDESSGDGWKYRGRSATHLTGKANYKELQDKTGIKFLENPDLLLEPYNSIYAAGYFWDKNKLNFQADTLSPESFLVITKRINGGTNGQDDRVRKWDIAKKALNVT